MGLQMAGIEDCYTSARGSTGTLGNFAKATYAAIGKTYSYLTPDLWKETVFTKSPYQEFTDFLAKNHKPVASGMEIETSTGGKGGKGTEEILRWRCVSDFLLELPSTYTRVYRIQVYTYQH